ncbi:MAG: Ku protein [Phycisphaerales bacterium]|nr:Ku protein [Phycisphaerales bacterium]
MPPRASWTGQLKCSLVAVPVRLYNAVSSSHRITLNQLHKKTHRRLRQQMMDPEEGVTERTDIVKGYEYEKGKYVIINDEDLDRIKLETNKVIDIVQFIDADELDSMYLNNPYFVAPDGPVAEEAFRVIREAMKATNKVGVGRVVMTNREHIVTLRHEDKGLVLTTLRYASEVRGSAPYFEGIQNGDIDRAQLQLAKQLIDSMATPFDPSQFNDRYQDALMDVIKAKIDGSEPVIAQEEEVGKVINLMEALKKSVANAPKKKPPAKSIKKAAKAKTKKAKRA